MRFNTGPLDGRPGRAVDGQAQPRRHLPPRRCRAPRLPPPLPPFTPVMEPKWARAWVGGRAQVLGVCARARTVMVKNASVKPMFHSTYSDMKRTTSTMQRSRMTASLPVGWKPLSGGKRVAGRG